MSGKKKVISLTGIKSGQGSAGNSALWRAARCDAFDAWFAVLCFGSYAGAWSSVYKISQETYDAAGTFENDDWKTERLLRKGKLLYRYENDRNSPEPVELFYDKKYEALCRAMLELK